MTSCLNFFFNTLHTRGSKHCIKISGPSLLQFGSGGVFKIFHKRWMTKSPIKLRTKKFVKQPGYTWSVYHLYYINQTWNVKKKNIFLILTFGIAASNLLKYLILSKGKQSSVFVFQSAWIKSTWTLYIFLKFMYFKYTFGFFSNIWFFLSEN